MYHSFNEYALLLIYLHVILKKLLAQPSGEMNQVMAFSLGLSFCNKGIGIGDVPT